MDFKPLRAKSRRGEDSDRLRPPRGGLGSDRPQNFVGNRGQIDCGGHPGMATGTGETGKIFAAVRRTSAGGAPTGVQRAETTTCLNLLTRFIQTVKLSFYYYSILKENLMRLILLSLTFLGLF